MKLGVNAQIAPVDAMMNAVEWQPLEGEVPEGDDLPYATHEGVLSIGGFEFKCWQFSDGRRAARARRGERDAILWCD